MILFLNERVKSIQYFFVGVLLQWKTGWQRNEELVRKNVQRRPQFRRALFIVGLLLRHFDFTDVNVIQGLPVINNPHSFY